ncbi:hypothetical protein FACS189490_06690 [Clostridia bacterium]|nr:hypothetical protein FACS189490_06690 [Clostridia bacterium]
MKKAVNLVLASVLAVSALFGLAGCSGGNYKDGTYFAEGAAYDDHSHWKENLYVVVKGGKIVDVSWNATFDPAADGADTKMDKKFDAKAGKYGMLKASAIGKEWDQHG